MKNDELDLLLRRVKKGDEKAFEEFYHETKKGLFSFIYSYVDEYYDCKNLLIDTYCKVRENIQRYKDGTNPVAWLFQIAKNLALNYIKKKKKEEPVDYSENEHLTAYEEPSIKMNSILKRINESLDKEDAQIVILHLVDGYKHKEIATILEKPLGTILWKYNKAIEKLKSVFGEEDND